MAHEMETGLVWRFTKTWLPTSDKFLRVYSVPEVIQGRMLFRVLGGRLSEFVTFWGLTVLGIVNGYSATVACEFPQKTSN